jgi:hypothetical protein
MPLVGEKRFRKPRTGDVHALDAALAGACELVTQAVGHVARLRAEHRRQQQRRVGRVVAEARLPWDAPRVGATEEPLPD